jgi:hypothetical protein
MATLDTRVSTPAEVTLEPQAAEAFASAFVPVWQFDDAPFSVGGKLAARDFEELGTGAGANSERAGPPIPTPLAPAPPSAVIADEPIQRVAPFATAPSLAAPTLEFDDGEVFRPRPRTGLIVGVVAFAAAILAILGIALTRSAGPPTSTVLVPTLASTHAVEEIPAIPPPPLVSDITATSASAALVAAPSGTVQALPSSSPHRPTSPPRARASESSHPPRSAVQPSKSLAKTGSGGLVRDNPF